MKYIFAVLLIAVVWGLWWWLKLPLWIAVVSTIVIVLVLVTIVIWGIVKSRRAAAKIEAALAKQGAAQAAGARPDLQADINAMSSEFNKAVGALKGSKLGKDALYTLPWYVIIGPPGVGKSTALRNSGLQFPYLSERGGGAVKGIGGTRNCDWWMTNQAVIVDTAGRYTTEDTDRDEWLAFLDLLRDTRPKRPINGILLAVAVSDFVEASEDEVNTMAMKIRARIDEVTKHLEMSVPVYVLFTKCDLLPGFVEMYSEMGKNERKDIWGFTLPVTGAYAGVDPLGTFCDQFDRLADRTEQRALRRMSDERRIDARGKVYAFPQHFEALRDKLANFIGLVFQANVYAETPMLRGCYFTSGTQEGRPIDRLMGSMAQAFGMQASSLLGGSPQVEARSYFLGNLFNKVIFADRELARRSQKHLRKAGILKWGAAAAIFILAVGAAVLPVRSMRANQEVISELNTAVETIDEEGAEDASPILSVERGWPIYSSESELYAFETDSTPVKLRWGMYQGETLMQPSRGLFGRTLREELVVPLMEERRLELANFANRYPTDEDEPPVDESGQAFDSLRAYLLLAGSLADYKDLSEDLQGQAKSLGEDSWLAAELADWWSTALLVDSESASYKKMAEMTSEYVKVLRERPEELEIEYDEALVEDVRKVLRRSDRTEALLAELIRSAGETDGVKDVTLASMKLGTSVYKNGGMRVRGAFTRQGWEKYCRSELAKNQGEFVGQEWVLGLSDIEAKERRMEDRLRLRSRYFDQYIKEWDQFVAKIYVEPATTLVGSLTMFQDLARGGTPLRRILNQVGWHVDLKEEERKPGDKPWWDQVPTEMKDKLEKEALEQGARALYERHDIKTYFDPFVGFGIDISSSEADPDGPPDVAGNLQIDAYAEQLTAVRDALQAAVDDRDALEDLGKRIKIGTNVVKGQVAEQQEPWRSRYDNILRPPFDAVRGALEGDMGAQVGESWCEAVYIPWQEQVGNRFPFDPKGYDMPLSEFSAWIGPDQGPIWDFYTASLSGRIEKNGNRFSIKSGGKASTLSYNARLPPFLTDVADAGSVMFPPGSAEPKFEFEVQIDGTPGVQEITLTVDGAKVSYRNGPQTWKTMVWPGTEGDPGASIRAKGLSRNGDVSRKGEWGFWRLLAEANVSGAAGQQVYSIKWDLSDQQVGVITIRLRPKRNETPLFGVPSRGSNKYLGLFTSMTVPRSVVAGYACQGESEGAE
nr:type VI secretion system membrane subunit TssM [Pseudenhygromyxa sp. WMMC2535]